MLQTTGLGPGLIRAAGRTSPQPGLAGPGPQRTLQHSAVGPPSTSDDHDVPSGAWGGSPKWSRHDVCRSFLRESGIGLAIPAAHTAPRSRASLLDAMWGFGSLRREDAQPPVAPRREGDTRQQKVLRTSHARYSAHQSAADLGSACYGRALLRCTHHADAKPRRSTRDDPRTQDQRDITRCRVECD